MVGRPSRSKVAPHHSDMDNTVDPSPSQSSQAPSQPLPEDPLLPGDTTPERDSHALALHEARAQKSVAPPSSLVSPPPVASAPLPGSVPTLAELMDDAMDVCSDTPITPVQQFQDLLASKRSTLHKVSAELADCLYRVQKIMEDQPPEAHASLLHQRDALTAPLKAQLDLLDSDIAFLEQSHCTPCSFHAFSRGEWCTCSVLSNCGS